VDINTKGVGYVVTRSWFVKFKGFEDHPYPGGQGLAQNSSFHVPTCDWYNNGTAPRCSGFYHVGAYRLCLMSPQ
jgi:hypothetical protein